jgi:hypothetical protein
MRGIAIVVETFAWVVRGPVIPDGIAADLLLAGPHRRPTPRLLTVP